MVKKLSNESIVLVTGSAGFIGFHVCKKFLENGYKVIGIDSISDYYSTTLKHARHSLLREHTNFVCFEKSILDRAVLEHIFDKYRPKIVVHLAAQAGVRYSIENPREYFDTNLSGTFELMNILRSRNVGHFLMASTSSIYGANEVYPYFENDKADHQISFYAATKKSTEILAHSFSHTYNIPTTCLRFFTVYGPWGRPDMAIMKFTKCIKSNEPIEIYNEGEMYRDFTFIDDLIDSIYNLSFAVPVRGEPVKSFDFDSLSKVAPFRPVNLGNGDPVKLVDFIEVLEKQLGKKASKKFLPMQAGDVKITYANNDLLKALINDVKVTSLETGIEKFVNWYNRYYEN